MISVSHRVVRRFRKMRYVRFTAQRYGAWSADASSPFLSPHPQGKGFQKCKPVPTLKPSTNRQMKLLCTQLIQQLPKAKYKCFSLELKPLGMIHITSQCPHSSRCEERWIREVIAHWRMEAVTWNGESYDLDSSLFWTQVGLCGHLKLPLLPLLPGSLTFSISGMLQCWWPHHPPPILHATLSPTLFEYLLYKPPLINMFSLNLPGTSVEWLSPQFYKWRN